MFILVFIVTLLILVLIHEFGHFLAAKKFGIKVLEFGFGLPPRVFGKKFGETLYSLNWLPFGGFVRLLGEDEPSPPEDQLSKRSRHFSDRPVWQRITVVVVGVLMNLSLALVIFWAVLAFQGFKVTLPLISEYSFIGADVTVTNMVVISKVSPGSPAAKVGLKPGDRIIEADGERIEDSNDLIALARGKGGEVISLKITDLQETAFKIIEVTPREDPPKGQGPLGIFLGTFQVANLTYNTLVQKIFSAPTYSINLIGYNVKILGDLISISLQKQDITPVSESVAGPVGITTIVKDIIETKNPILPYLNFLAVLSLNLAIINILPFPGLDGGRLFFLIIEGVTRKKPHANFEKYIHTVGLALLLGLVLLITISDIRKIFL